MEKFTLKTSFYDFLELKSISKEDFDKIEDVDKRDELASEYRDLANKAIQEAVEDKASKEDILKLEKQIEASLKANVEAIDLAYKKSRIANSSIGFANNKSLLEVMNEAIQEKSEDLLKVANDQKGTVRIAVKAPITVGVSNTIGASGSASQTSITQDTGIISPVRKRMLTYLNEATVSTLSVTEPFVMWMEELDEQGAPTFHGELDASPNASVRYEERRQEAKTASVMGTITKNFLRYTSQLFNYMQTNLMKRLDIVVENGLFVGDGTGNNLSGLVGYATAFDGGKGVKNGDGLVGKVVSPNNWDVMKAVALQVYNSYGMGSALFVDSDKLSEMEVSKDTNGNYIMPPFKTADGQTVSGMKLIPTTAGLGGNDFVGGDLSAVNVGILLDVNFEIGYNGTDFKDRRISVIAERQLTQFVSANDTKVLVKGTFAVAKELIATT